MKKFKSGFTMSELIIVLVIMGVLAYITFNKLFGAKTKQEIENAIKADLEAITSSADKYRLNNREGKYTGLTVSKIAGSLPSNMKQMSNAGAKGSSSTDEWVGSLSFGEMCRYIVASNTGDKDRTFNIAMNCIEAKSNLGWNDTESALTEQVFWEFINRKYGYSDKKGLVNPKETPGTVSALTTANLSGKDYNVVDIQPLADDNDGAIIATDLRGF